MALLSTNELKNRLTVQLPKKTPYNLSCREKMENIETFCKLSRENLSYTKRERRLLLYTTLQGEKIYYQYPGKESGRKDERKFEEDARPILIKNSEQSPDMDFKRIWDVIDYLGNEHKADADILGAVFLRIAYMYHYVHESRDFVYEEIDYTSDSQNTSDVIKMEWNRLSLDDDVIETLNDRFTLPKEYDFSFEAFLYYNDILAQNEDNKYYLHSNKKKEFVLQKGNGRINNCLSHLTVISHIRGFIGISKLIDSFQRLGVAPLPQSRLSEACGDLVVRE